MSIKAMQDFTFVSRYARYLKELHRRELWHEAIERVENMHLSKYPQVKEEINWAFDKVREKKVLGSQRALQFGGEPILKKNMRLYNCTGSHCDRLRFFQEAFWVLLCGCLPPDTKIKTEKGLKPISEIKIGEKVWSFNLEEKKEELKLVTDKHDIFVTKKANIKITGEKGWFITSKRHPVLVFRNGWEYVPAGLVEVGDKLKTFSNEDKIVAIEDNLNIDPDFKDITVEENHNYYCGEGDSYVLHNCGAGFSVQKHHVAKLPELSDRSSLRKSYYSVPDSIEGWADSLGVLLSSYFEEPVFPEYYRSEVEFDYSNIRLEGAPLGSCSGKAPGPRPLMKALKNVKKLLDKVVREGEKKLHPIHAYDIVMHSSDAVLSGGVRRCLAKGSRVIIKNRGFKGIENVTVGDLVLTPDGYRKVLNTFDQGVQQIIRVHHHNGYIDCTMNHKFCVIKDEEKVWVKAIDLKPDDELFFVREFEEVENNDLFRGIKRTFYWLLGLWRTRIPSIKTADKFCKAAYVQGLFDSSKGEFESKDVEFLRDIQSVLYSIGIVSRLSGKRLFLERHTDKMLFYGLVKGSNSDLYKHIASNDKIVKSKVSYFEFLPDKVPTYDIEVEENHCFVCEGVVVHNSATIATFSHDDEEMLNAKTGNWFYENPQRARSNNSVVLVRDEIKYEDFKNIMKSVKEFGEPGFLFTSSKEQISNPCVEISWVPICPDTGKTAWVVCNLTEINGGMIKTKEDFKKAARAAAIIGTLQAGYTNFPYLGEITENLVKKESLLGVSITGIMENPDIILNPDIQQEMARLVLETNAEIAPKIGINLSARSTAVKPAGTTSCLLGTSSGIHTHHAKRYFRRIQNNRNEAPYQHFAKHNPECVEKSVWSANGTDDVINFCIEVGDNAKTKKDYSAVEFLEVVKSTQQNWIVPGTRKELCIDHRLTHNVSNTVNVDSHEWDDVTRVLYENRNYFSGVSLLPATGDLDYAQAPWVEVLDAEEIKERYGETTYSVCYSIMDGFEGDLWKSCDIVLGFVKEDNDWADVVREEADKLGVDYRKMTYCLKHIWLWNKWIHLKNSYKDVDYSYCIEHEDNTKLMQEVACAGGACQIF